MSLRAFNYAEAQGFFEAALAHDTTLLRAQHQIIVSWSKQGFRKKAQEIAQRLASEKDLLTPRQAEDVASWAVRLGPDRQKRQDLLLARFNSRPDDVDLGFELVRDTGSKKKGAAFVQRLRQLPPPLSEDIRLDAAEALALSVDDPKRASELLERLERRAAELGARSEQAYANRLRGREFSDTPLQVVRQYREAVRLYSEVGDLENVATALGELAWAQVVTGPIREALKTIDEAAGAYRRVGNRWELHRLLSIAANFLGQIGDGERATKRIEEARTEVEFLEEPPSDHYLFTKPILLYWNADLTGGRAALQAWRAFRGPDNPQVLMLEAWVLRQQDSLEQARSSYQRAQNGAGAIEDCAVRCDQGQPTEGLACLSRLAPTQPEGILYRDLEEARCRYMLKDFPGAEKAARSALAAKEPFIDRVPASIEVARAMAANGQRAKAISDLKRTLAEIEASRFYQLFAFEATLALGEAELAAGMLAGKARLQRLEEDAKSQGCFRIARLAREALDRNRPRKPR
jgi:tetratricopeptide (TPR) repeat protein